MNKLQNRFMDNTLPQHFMVHTENIFEQVILQIACRKMLFIIFLGMCCFEKVIHSMYFYIKINFQSFGEAYENDRKIPSNKAIWKIDKRSERITNRFMDKPLPIGFYRPCWKHFWTIDISSSIQSMQLNLFCVYCLQGDHLFYALLHQKRLPNFRTQLQEQPKE